MRFRITFYMKKKSEMFYNFSFSSRVAIMQNGFGFIDIFNNN